MVTMTKTLLIGYGDIARRLRPLLLGQVVAIRRHPSLADEARALDANDRDAMRALLTQDFDQIVITLTPSARTDSGYQQGYVAPVQLLVALLGELRLAPRVVFVSSTSVYGQNNGDWVDEASPTAPDSFAGRRLLEAESLLLGSALPVVIARLSGIYGPGREYLLNQLRQGVQPARSLLAWSNRIHADDAARALQHLLSLPVPEPVYLVSDSKPVLLAEVVNGLALALGQAPVEHTVLAPFTGKRVRNDRLLASGFSLHYPDWRAGYKTLVPGL